MSDSVYIFDSLAHPTINGNWIHSRYDQNNTIELYFNNANESGIRWAFCVGMNNIGSYDEEKYIENIRRIDPQLKRLFPIAYIDINDLTNIAVIEKRLHKIKKLGYYGIKIHPRFTSLNINSMGVFGICIAFTKCLV